MKYAKRIDPGSKVKLKNEDPSESAGLSKEEGSAKLAELAAKIAELQELMSATSDHAFLVAFQGMDTAGKDGAINKILSYVNVQSARVQAFKVPTPIELAHDFLWRVHAVTPACGGMTIFNRSHYEDVLVVRVHNIVPEEVWKRRYDHINNFEALIADSRTTIIKFFLHISKDEQEQRLLDREKDPTKSWKLSVGDWKEREFWDDYQEAYQDALERCSTDQAPWHIIPANHKWFRDLAVAEVIYEAMKPFEKGWRDKLAALGATAKADIQAFKAGETAKPTS
ncbi:MAG: polyphosphate kinase 2 family protein [Armatimonadetes bacterium]|nr:polyphosphate kinase 2 family protein [Armatimonadota bacterium]